MIYEFQQFGLPAAPPPAQGICAQVRVRREVVTVAFGDFFDLMLYGVQDSLRYHPRPYVHPTKKPPKIDNLCPKITKNRI